MDFSNLSFYVLIMIVYFYSLRRFSYNRVLLFHFRWKGPTRADIAQLPVVHAHTLPRESPSGSRDLRSLRVAMVLVLLYYILYYYSKKKTRSLSWLPVSADSGDFRSGPLPVTWFPVTSLPVSPRSFWNTVWTVLIYYWANLLKRNKIFFLIFY